MTPKTALITGGTCGIGLEIAKIHAASGGDLVIVARNLTVLKEVKSKLESEFKINIHIFQIDLSKSDAGTKLYADIKEQGIEIDYLINNAGIGGYGYFQERKWSEDVAMMQLNMISFTELTRLFLSDFINKNSGKILNVSSSAGLMPGPLQAVYFATKAYVNSLSYAISQEIENSSVTMTVLMPAPTKTDFVAKSGVGDIKMFSDLADPFFVAKEGYEGMIAGQLKVISGYTFWQKIRIKLIPFISLKLLLQMIYKNSKRTID